MKKLLKILLGLGATTATTGTTTLAIFEHNKTKKLLAEKEALQQKLEGALKNNSYPKHNITDKDKEIDRLTRELNKEKDDHKITKEALFTIERVDISFPKLQKFIEEKGLPDFDLRAYLASIKHIRDVAEQYKDNPEGIFMVAMLAQTHKFLSELTQKLKNKNATEEDQIWFNVGINSTHIWNLCHIDKNIEFSTDKNCKIKIGSIFPLYNSQPDDTQY